METKIDIATILKDKPENIKLYSPLFGYVYFLGVEDDIIKVTYQGRLVIFFGDGRYYNYPESEPLLFPSKKMRDWSKFAWKKGDILTNSSGFKLFFDRWANDDYTRFFGKVNILENSFSYETEKYTLEAKEETIDTLEIEKPEFKDGDIAFADFDNRQDVFIVSGKTNLSEGYYSFIVLNLNSTKALSIGYKTSFFKENLNTIRLATEKEKQQLFSALKREGKAWDAEKKMIVDLKKKVELKPFDKVVVRCSEADRWSIDFFSYKAPNGYICTGDAWFGYCLPYNEETAKLIGTTKDIED